MKMKLLAIAFLCYGSHSFAQNTESYVEIVLDGKKAWMDKTTGYVKYENPEKTTTTITAQSNPVKISDTTFTYQVIKGDTYYSISKEHHCSLTQLLAANNLTKTQPLKIGQLLKIRPQKSSKKILKKETINQHTVLKGETLYSISRMYKISVQDLTSKNHLKNHLISTGQLLRIN